MPQGHKTHLAHLSCAQALDTAEHDDVLAAEEAITRTREAQLGGLGEDTLKHALARLKGESRVTLKCTLRFQELCLQELL